MKIHTVEEQKNRFKFSEQELKMIEYAKSKGYKKCGFVWKKNIREFSHYVSVHASSGVQFQCCLKGNENAGHYYDTGHLKEVTLEEFKTLLNVFIRKYK